jgi:hypothetical protein
MQTKTLRISGLFALACSFLMSNSAALQAQTLSWSSVFSNAKVEISEAVTNCTYDYSPMDNSESILLRVKNKTANSVTLKFRLDSYFNGECLTCANEEYIVTVKLGPNATITGSCGAEATETQLRLVVFKRYTSRDNFQVFDEYKITQVSAN